MKQKKIWMSLSVFILICVIVQIIGSFWSNEPVAAWYPQLIKPSWTPPDALFGPVWSLLYLMIAIAGWLIYRAPRSEKRRSALIWYGIQLSLNFIWPFLFFFLRNPLLGFIDIVLLGLSILLTLFKAWQVRPIASLLLIPYLAWILYATALNMEIWLLNR